MDTQMVQPTHIVHVLETGEPAWNYSDSTSFMRGSDSTAPPMGCGRSAHPQAELDEEVSEGEMCDHVNVVRVTTFSDTILYFDVLFDTLDCPYQTYDMIHCRS